MKYDFINGRYVPIVYCGNCHKKMELTNIDGYGKGATYYMGCDDTCLSWCKIRFGKIIDYGTDKD